METLVNRVVEQGLPTYLLDEIDVLVFPRHTDGERYVGEVVELVDESTFREYERDRKDGRCGVIRKDETTVYWNTVVDRTPRGSFEFAYDHPKLGDDERRVRTRAFDRIATLTDRPVEDVEAEFHRKHHYVQYLEREGVTDGQELFAFLADLATEEAATVERIRRRRDVDGPRPHPTVPTDNRDTAPSGRPRNRTDETATDDYGEGDGTVADSRHERPDDEPEARQVDGTEARRVDGTEERRVDGTGDGGWLPDEDGVGSDREGGSDGD